MLAEHAHHGRRRRVLALLLAGGDDEAAGDVAQAHLLAAQGEGGGEHGGVGDRGPARGLPPAAGGGGGWVGGWGEWGTGGGGAYPIRTCPAGGGPADGGRGSSVQAEPGLRTGGTGTLRAFARWGTSRNRAVWYWAATLPRLVRQGDPAGAVQDDIGQSLASTRRKSSSLTCRSFHVAVAIVELFATTNET